MLDKSRRHRGREVHHLQPFAANSDFAENRPNPAGALAGPKIAFQKMAASFQAPCHQNSIDALLKSFKDVLIARQNFMVRLGLR